jgi:hypothetical protein
MLTWMQPCKFGGITMGSFHHQLFWTMSIFSGSTKSNILPSSTLTFLRWQDVIKVRNVTLSVPLVYIVQCSKLATIEFLSARLVNTENGLNMGTSYEYTKYEPTVAKVLWFVIFYFICWNWAEIPLPYYTNTQRKFWKSDFSSRDVS